MQTQCFASTDDSNNFPKTAVMIVLDRIDLEDLAGDYPNLKNLISGAAVGLMNTRPGGNYDPASCYLSIGAGSRAHTGGKGKNAFMAFEKYESIEAGSAFKLYTGLSVPNNAVVQLDIARIIEESKRQNYEVKPGLLGEILKNSGIPVSVLGNADTDHEKNRMAALIAMDSNGIVHSGYVAGDINTRDESSPFFLKTDYDKLYRKFMELKKKGGLIVIHLGDTARANDIVDLVTPELYENYRVKALKDCDEFFGKIIDNLDTKRDLLLVVTPFPSFNGYREKKLLTPFIAIGPNLNRGLAISSTTRRAGIIANVDIAPTVLSFFQIPVPVEMFGHPIESVYFTNAYDHLLKLSEKATLTYTYRPYFIKSYVVMQILVSLTFLFFIYYRKNYLVFIRPFLLASMSLPLTFLLLALIPGENNIFYMFFWTIIITIAAVIIASKAKSTAGAVSLISLSTALAIVADLLSGGKLLGSSVLGHDPIAGARYYGLGNEYMGVLVGSTVIGVTTLFDNLKINRQLLTAMGILIFSISFCLISSPSFGSNVGGAITACGAYLTTLILLSGSKLNFRTFVGILAITAFFTLLLFLFSVVSGPPSHISQTVDLIREGGMKPAVSIVIRKVSMNYRLFKYTPWTRALVTTIAALISLSFKPPNTMKKIFKKQSNFYAGFTGTSIGSILALIFNDSGIVASGTMAIFFGLPVLLFIADENINDKSEMYLKG
ncbi:hypothetical protein [Fervidicola ferrireducens]|uniref:hypothetical protein n=1 Tax=Fervidicola ferrireducens TaxID=520764 RepID=UPI001656D3E7|nr:hypothetical protein [Fervidicola ferrireducens]